MKPVIIVVICLLCASCLLPETRQLTDIAHITTDFTMQGEPETVPVTGLGRTMPELAPLLTEYGADSLLTADYSHGNEQYAASVYQFGTTKGAMGAYLATGMAGSDGLDIGYSGRSANSTVQFVKGYYLISVTAAGNGSLDGASALASTIASQIEGGKIEPLIFESYPEEHRKQGSEFYFMGPVAFTARYGRDLANSLRIAEAVEGSAVTYMIDGYPVEIMKITYPDRNATKFAMDTYISVHRDNPVILNDRGLAYASVIKPERYEDYVAEMGDRLFIMIDARQNGAGQEQFEYLLRSAQ